MLNPFKIRDLHETSSLGSEGSPSSHGVVQISASDYDNLASNHPRARLTYMDDDDGDQITVGSSLELSQRLDEPLDIEPRLDAVQLSEDERVPMHIFDIRRSNSVTELWKRFESHSSKISKLPGNKNNVTAATESATYASDQGDHSVADTSATAVPGDVSQSPLLAAFEAELANILESAEEPAERAPQPEPSSTAHSSRNTNFQGFPHVAEALASQIMHHLASGANMVQSELRTRLPELQRQVRDAQMHLPENIGMTLQALLATLEAHVRTAFHNLPDNGRQWADNGRHWAEDAFQAGRPVAENAAESFRMMASEVNEAGRSFIAAFEQELARATSRPTNMASDASNPPPAPFSYPPGSASASSTNTQNTESQLVSGLHENHTMGYNQSQPAEYGTTSRAMMADPSLVNPGLQAAWAPPPNWPHFAPSESLHSGFLNRNSFCPAGNMNQMNAHVETQGAQLPSLPQCNGPPPPPKWPQQPSVPISGMAPQSPNDDSKNSHVTSKLPSSDLPTSAPPQADHSGNKTLFIGNVGFKVTERTIQDVFASKGFIVDVDLPLDAVTGRHAGFGYLHFPSIYPAIAAMDALQGAHIDGHAINLEYSDAAPIDSVGSEAAIDITKLPSSQPNTQTMDKEPSEPKQAQPTSMKRRKSVTFKDPPLTEPQATALRPPKTEPDTTASVDKASASPLIDFSADESTSPAPPVSSFSNEPWHQSASQDGLRLPDWSPELEMTRFPPVSQLEAQYLANQRQHEIIRPAAEQESRAGNESDAATTQSQFQSNWGVPGPSLYSSPSNPLQRSRTISHTHGESHHDVSAPGLRRANTTLLGQLRGMEPTGSNRSTPFSSTVEFPSSPRPKRRVNQRQSLRDPSSVESDTFARLDRRTRERSRSKSSSRHSIPGSFPVEEPPSSNSFDVEVEKCVSSLIDMGYGTAEDGGRARMAVYAAASNNNLMDAIDMIEEERKAYEWHGRE